uniref:Putative chemosensory ionotropic receptor IR41a n=1 Tax=Spodoptera littoralis TaxID=7109 RepID=E5FIA6_SPOLI|nr:putative chemosensory ionotropic receptor IR41a [Spodoptera littoralis]
MLLPTISLPLEILLNTIITQYLDSSYCVTVFSDKPLSPIISTSFIYLIPDEENLVEQIYNVSERGCSDYIVRMRDPQNFMTAFERVVHIGNVRRSDRKIIILPYNEEYNDNNDENLPSLIFSMKGSEYLANMLMVVNHNSSNSDCKEFDLITHQYVGPDDVSNLPKYLDRWDSCSQQFENNANLFPHDMTNLFGKTLRVACFTYKPYALLDIDTAIEPLGRDGVEIRIVDEFCRWVNCTVEVVREDVDQWGEIYKNESGGIGVIGSVVKDRADLGITALYSWYEEYRVMDFSVAGVRTAITCIAPAPRLLSSWEMPLMPFTWYMWLAVVFTYFICLNWDFNSTGIWFIIVSILNAFGMMIGQSQYEGKPSWKIRSVTGWLLIAGLILSSAYGAGLASTFTVPRYEPSIDTVQDIVDRKMEWGATHDAWIFSLTLSTEPLVKELVSQFRIYSFDELKRKSFTRSMAYSIEKLPAGNFAIGEYVTQEAILDMMVMLEDFYYEQCVVMMRKSSPYTEKVSQLIGRLHQSGLLLAWETQVALKHLNYKVQVEVRLSRSKNDVGTTKALNLGNVMGIFIVYAIGLMLSIATFLGELYVHHHKQKKERIHVD